jgi:hypothetical protein
MKFCAPSMWNRALKSPQGSFLYKLNFVNIILIKTKIKTRLWFALSPYNIFVKLNVKRQEQLCFQ